MTNTELYSATSSTLGTTAGADLVALAADLDVSYVYEVLAGLNSALTGDAADVAATIAASYGEAADSDLATWTEGFLNDGYTAAQILEAYDAFLLSTDNAEAVATLGLDDAKSTLENKNSVSEYYSETLGLDFVDLTSGQAQLADVDATDESVTAAQTALDSIEVTALIDAAAAAAYAEYTLPATATAAEEATALAAKLNAATTAIDAGATQDEIDAAYDVLVSDGAAALTLANITTLADANTAVSDYLAAVDTTVVDPTTVDDDADADTTTADTVAAATDVHTSYTTANTTLSGLVSGTADYSADSAETQAALYAAQLATVNNALSVTDAAIVDAQDDIDDVEGLAAAITALETATTADTAADAAATATQATLDIAEAGFNALHGTAVLDTVSGKVHNVSVAATPGVAGSTTEKYVVTMSALTAGQAITIDGKTLTATASMTAAEAATAFAALTDGALYTVVNDGAADALTFTSVTATTDVANLIIESSGSETVFEGLAALKAAHTADIAADAAATDTQTDLDAAIAAVAAIDPDTTITADMSGTTATLLTTPVDSSAMTAAEVTAEVAAMNAAVTAAAVDGETVVADLSYFDTDNAGTVAALDAGVDALIAALDAVSTFDSDEATTEAIGTALTATAVTDGFISAADKTAIDAALTTENTISDDATTVTAFDAAVAVINVTTGANNQVNELDTLIDAITAAAEIQVISDAFDATVDAGTSPLYAALTAAQDASSTETDGVVDGGAQLDINNLIAAKAEYDALVGIDTALTALEATVTTATAAVDSTDLATGADTMGADTVAFITDLVASNASVVSDFDVATDSIYFGDDFTVNTGALTTGDNTVIEMFITEGTTAADSLVTFETKAYGSESTGDFFTVELTGVATTDIAIADGMIVGA